MFIGFYNELLIMWNIYKACDFFLYNFIDSCSGSISVA